MTHLRLIIKNSNISPKNKNYFFDKSELKIILNLYAKMVRKGFWKDYGLNVSNEKVSSNIYKKTSGNAEFRICKNFKIKNGGVVEQIGVNSPVSGSFGGYWLSTNSRIYRRCNTCLNPVTFQDKILARSVYFWWLANFINFFCFGFDKSEE